MANRTFNFDNVHDLLYQGMLFVPYMELNLRFTNEGEYLRSFPVKNEVVVNYISGFDRKELQRLIRILNRASKARLTREILESSNINYSSEFYFFLTVVGKLIKKDITYKADISKLHPVPSTKIYELVNFFSDDYNYQVDVPKNDGFRTISPIIASIILEDINNLKDNSYILPTQELKNTSNILIMRMRELLSNRSKTSDVNYEETMRLQEKFLCYFNLKSIRLLRLLQMIASPKIDEKESVFDLRYYLKDEGVFNYHLFHLIGELSKVVTNNNYIICENCQITDKAKTLLSLYTVNEGIKKYSDFANMYTLFSKFSVVSSKDNVFEVKRVSNYDLNESFGDSWISCLENIDLMSANISKKCLESMGTEVYNLEVNVNYNTKESTYKYFWRNNYSSQLLKKKITTNLKRVLLVFSMSILILLINYFVISLWNGKFWLIYGVTSFVFIASCFYMIILSITVNRYRHERSEGELYYNFKINAADNEKRKIIDYNSELNIQIKDMSIEINKKRSELNKTTNQLEYISKIDHLTDIYSRHYISEKILRMIERYKLFGETFAVMLIDIDNLKFINDKFGQKVGDEILKKISRIIKDNVRKYDCVGRWVGGEFIIILSMTSNDGVVLIKDKILAAVENCVFDNNVKLKFNTGFIDIQSMNCNLKTDEELRDTMFSELEQVLSQDA